MNTIFLLYVVTKIDSVITLLGMIGGLGMSFSVIYFFMCHETIKDIAWKVKRERITVEEAAEQGAIELKKQFKSKLYFIGFAIIGFIAICLPSQKDLLFIVGGNEIISIAKDPDVKRIASKTLQMLEKTLDSNLEQGNKE